MLEGDVESLFYSEAFIAAKLCYEGASGAHVLQKKKKKTQPVIILSECETNCRGKS